MDSTELLLDALGRLRALVPAAVADLDADRLARSPEGRGNPVGWLVWHLTRVQDDHVADAAGTPQVWLSGGWQERFALDLPAGDTGYGHTPDEVARVRAGADLLTGYHEAVADRTAEHVASLTPADLDRVVDDAWDPPVTLGVRLVSVLSDCLQHAGQAAYARGLADG